MPEPSSERRAADLLRASTLNLPKMEEKALRALLVESIMDGLPNLSTNSVQNVARFVDIVLRERGCATPAEYFIRTLVWSHYGNGRPGRGLTPQDVVDELESPDGFRSNFEELIERTKEFNLTYADLLNAKPEDTQNA